MSYFGYGKHKYSIISLPDKEWTYSYSATKFQSELCTLFTGKKLTEIYLELGGYLDSGHNDINLIDLTYMGGSALVLFEKSVLHLNIHVEGMIEYRHFPIWEMNIQNVYDYPPDDLFRSNNYFINVTQHELTFDYFGANVNNITVIGNDTWGFSQPRFDSEIAEAAAEKSDLPTEIVLHTNDCNIRFIGDSIEYYWLRFDK